MTTLEQDYEALRKKYNLPSFQEIDADFEIKCIDEYDFLIRELRNAVLEPVNLVLDVLEPILQPETTLAQMHESSVFTELEKQKLFEFYKRLMFYKRRATTLRILNNDAQDAVFINEVAAGLRDIKQQLLPYLKKLEESWTQEDKSSEHLFYLG